jgi:hypothetical protein
VISAKIRGKLFVISPAKHTVSESGVDFARLYQAAAVADLYSDFIPVQIGCYLILDVLQKALTSQNPYLCKNYNSENLCHQESNSQFNYST